MLGCCTSRCSTDVNSGSRRFGRLLIYPVCLRLARTRQKSLWRQQPRNAEGMRRRRRRSEEIQNNTTEQNRRVYEQTYFIFRLAINFLRSLGTAWLSTYIDIIVDEVLASVQRRKITYSEHSQYWSTFKNKVNWNFEDFGFRMTSQLRQRRSHTTTVPWFHVWS